MKVWLCIPSARPDEQAAAVVEKWRRQGYGIALFLDRHQSAATNDNRAYTLNPHFLVYPEDEYPGYARATNKTIEMVRDCDPECRWFVIGGDDVEPDANKRADEIAAECEQYFEKLNPGSPTLGVMQPTGDRWGETPERSAYIDRVCGSAWLGREFCERAYQGAGPLFPEYFHMFVDEELHGVASRLGLLWQRRDLIHFHKHWMRSTVPDPASGRMLPPAHLSYVSGQSHWNQAKALHARRRMLEYPGHQLAPKAAV